ncbi:MAG TPA: LysR family transcriptional regulator [Polyangiales bacterium]|nr:LysR family transcriptional regulator [Polyangiales bacterium]
MELSWDQVRYFLAVARAGSAMAAAQQLGVGHATVLRNIAQLEGTLGVRLFDRLRTGYRITSDGEDVLASAQGMESQAEALQRRALNRQPTPAGRLKLSICDSTLFNALPLLAELRKAYPRIELALDRERDAAARLSRLQVDAALMVGNTPPDELIGRQLARVNLRWFCSTRYLGRRAVPAAEDCEYIAWTGPSELDDAWQRAQLRRLTSQPRVVVQVDSHADALAAVRAGLGAALLSDAHSEALRKLPFAAPNETYGVWLLTHPDLRRSGRVRALFDFVAKAQGDRSLA